MFYDKFKELCFEKKISVNKATIDLGLNSSTSTKWKKTGACPDGITLSRIAKYFDVNANFFLEIPPFDCWELIIADLSKFLGYVDIDEILLKNIWNIEKRNLESISYVNLILFLTTAIKVATQNEDGSWNITLKNNFQNLNKRRYPLLPEIMYRFYELPYDKQQEVVDFLEFKISRQEEKSNESIIGQIAAFGNGPIDIPVNEEASRKLATLAKKKREKDKEK